MKYITAETANALLEALIGLALTCVVMNLIFLALYGPLFALEVFGYGERYQLWGVLVGMLCLIGLVKYTEEK
jgi:hypothetical protein